MFPKIWENPQIIHFNRVFHYFTPKSSIFLGFSIIFTIHFQVFPLFLGWHPISIWRDPVFNLPLFQCLGRSQGMGSHHKLQPLKRNGFRPMRMRSQWMKRWLCWQKKCLRSKNGPQRKKTRRNLDVSCEVVISHEAERLFFVFNGCIWFCECLGILLNNCGWWRMARQVIHSTMFFCQLWWRKRSPHTWMSCWYLVNGLYPVYNIYVGWLRL